MPFVRDQLPDPTAYFESKGLTLVGRGKWRSTSCVFHGGTASTRVNLQSGGWICMSCGVHGGDILAYEMLATGTEFVEAAKALGCWLDDGKRMPDYRPSPLSPRQAFSVMAFEATLVAVAAGNIAHGVALNEADHQRLIVATGRINKIVESFE